MLNFVYFGRLIKAKGADLVAKFVQKDKFQSKDFRLFVFGRGELEKKFISYKFDIPQKYILQDPLIISTDKEISGQLKKDIEWLKSNMKLFEKDGGLVEFADTDVLGFEVENNKNHFISKYGNEVYAQILSIHHRWNSRIILISSNVWEKYDLDDLTFRINKYLAQPWYYLIPIFKDQKIYYFGWQPFDVIAKWLDISDITLMPSIFLETFGLSALESLSRGVPVLAPSKGGLKPFVLPKLDLGEDWKGDEKIFEEIIYNLLNGKIRVSLLKERGLEIAKNYDIPNWLRRFEDIAFES